MIPEEGLCMIESFVLAHTAINLVKNYKKCIALLSKINYISI